MKLKKEKIYNPDKTVFANLVKFNNDDMMQNRLPNMNLRCTHLSYIVGEVITKEDGTCIFKDTVSEDEKEYLYFKSILEAQYYICDDTYEEPFVLHQLPIRKLGIQKECKKRALKEKLSHCNLYFNFTDETNEKTKEESKVKTMIRKRK